MPVEKFQHRRQPGTPDLELLLDVDLDSVFRRNVELLDIKAQQRERATNIGLARPGIMLIRKREIDWRFRGSGVPPEFLMPRSILVQLTLPCCTLTASHTAPTAH